MAMRRLRAICVSNYSFQKVIRVLVLLLFCLLSLFVCWNKIFIAIFFFWISVHFRWWISLAFATIEAVIISCFSLTYSIYAASQRYGLFLFFNLKKLFFLFVWKYRSWGWGVVSNYDHCPQTSRFTVLT